MTETEMAQEMKNALARGDFETINNLRKEFYNRLAYTAKKENDLLHLNLLAAVDEAVIAELPGAAVVLSTLVMFYALGRDGFNHLCTILSPTCSALARTIYAELGSMGTEDRE